MKVTIRFKEGDTITIEGNNHDSIKYVYDDLINRFRDDIEEIESKYDDNNVRDIVKDYELQMDNLINEIIYAMMEKNEIKSKKLLEDFLDHEIDINSYIGEIFDDPKFIAKNSRGYKYTLLHLAADQGLDQVVKFLIENGADIFAKDGEGNVPIFYVEDYKPLNIFLRELMNKKDECNQEDVTVKVTGIDMAL